MLAYRYYHWAPPGKGLSVRLSLDVVDALQAEVQKAAGEPAREVGGILLGHAEPDHAVYIDGLKPMPCQYTYGPAYVVTGRDEKRFAQALAKPPEDGRYPVGFYRTHKREAFGLTEEDLWLFSTHFARPYAVALLVKPRADGPGAAGFFFWENGSMRSESPYLEFPFDAKLLSAAAVGAARAPVRARRGARTRPWLRALAILALLLACAAAGFVAGRGFGTGIASRRPDPYLLGMSIAERDGNFHLTWNRRSGAILAAQRGALTIADGGTTKTMSLSREQLRNGSVVYQGAGGTVTFRLEVFPNASLSVSEVWPPRGRQCQ